MPRKKKDDPAEPEAPKAPAKLVRIPEGQDPHAFREKLQRALDSAPAGSMKSATYKRALKEVDEYIDSLPEPVEDGKEKSEKP